MLERWDLHFDHYDMMLSGGERRRLFGETVRVAALRRLREGLERGRGPGRRVYRFAFRLYEAWLKWTAMGLRSYRKRAVPSGEELNARARNWVEAQLGPFFVWVHYMDVHGPYVPRTEPLSRDDLRLLAKHSEFPAFLTRDEVSRLRFLYEECVREVDAHIGAFLDFLSSTGLAEKSLTIVTADHGEAFGEHGDFGHGQAFRATLYDELLRVPLIVRGLRRRGKVEDFVQLLDVAPTICDAVGIARPEKFRGENLLAPRKRGIVSNTKFYLSFRTTDLKLIVHKREPGKDELYDLKADPGEKRNVAASRPADLSRLRQALLAELPRTP
jgi:arylsulfatase A-like enzyme